MLVQYLLKSCPGERHQGNLELAGTIVADIIPSRKKERGNMAITVAEKECFGCASCVLVCPQEAMKITPSFIVHIDKDKCDECGQCLGFCPVDALKEA